MYLNKAILIGNLTRDPELKSLPSGSKVAEFGLATNRVWKDREGQKKEETQFHNIVVFGLQAENISRFLKKGSSALIEGRIQTRSWDAQDGSKRYRTEIVADRVQFGPRRAGEGGSPAPAAGVSDDAEAAQGGASGSAGIDYPQEESNPEDIPF
jgi:single-strand DNA-binding protein